MLVKELMTVSHVFIFSDDSIDQAAAKMKAAGVGCLVVRDSSEIIGVITDRDMVLKCTSEGHDPKHCNVSDHMTTKVAVISSTAPVTEAIKLMLKFNCRRLPVIEDGIVVGMLSLTEIESALAETLEAVSIVRGGRRVNWLTRSTSYPKPL